MRFQSFAFLGCMSVALAAAAGCGNSIETAQGSAATGSGGSTTSTGTTGTGATTATTTTSVATTSSVTTTSSSSGSQVFPAPHPEPPQVITGEGPVLAAPKIVPIYFSNDSDPNKSQIQDFEAKVGSTSYWSVAAEYGVGPATALPVVELAETATGTLDDNAIQAWLAGKLNANDPAFPPADPNTVYAIHYPSVVTITQPDPLAGGNITSCTDFGGYHNETTLDANHGGMPVAYAVLPRCQSFGPLFGIDAATGAEAHELMEAATDPFPQTNPGWVETDEAHLYWDLAVGGGEIGDMCAQDPEAFTKFAELPYTVQRIWSNKAALQGHDPCVPALPGEVYFNSAPEMNDTITLSIEGQTISLTGVKIPVGQSKTINLDLFSDGPTSGPWDVEVHDLNELEGQPPTLGFNLPNNSGSNGDKLPVTITAKKQGQFGISVFFVISRQGNNAHFWVGDVGN
jgi:hypothetical protein